MSANETASSAPSRRAPFSAVAVAAMALVGVFAFVSFLALQAFTPERPLGEENSAHALSRSAIGYSGIVALARSRGQDVRILHTAPTTQDSVALAIVTPRSPPDRAEITRIADRVGAVLIVPPKWPAIALPTRPGWVVRTEPHAAPYGEAFLREVTPEAILTLREGVASGAVTIEAASGQTQSRVRFSAIQNLRTIAGPNLTPIATTEDGRTILASLSDDPRILILSDPDFINNQGLADLATAHAGLAIIDRANTGAGLIGVDVTLAGFDASAGILRQVFTPPFLGVVFALAVAAALIAWRAAFRPGPIAPEGRALAFGKRALADNSAALIRLARREHAMAWPYAMVTAARARALAPSLHIDPAQELAALDQLAAAHRVSPSLAELASEASNAKTRRDALVSARKLHTWIEELKRVLR